MQVIGKSLCNKETISILWCSAAAAGVQVPALPQNRGERMQTLEAKQNAPEQSKMRYLLMADTAVLQYNE